jgi:hypothetical protein
VTDTLQVSALKRFNEWILANTQDLETYTVADVVKKFEVEEPDLAMAVVMENFTTILHGLIAQRLLRIRQRTRSGRSTTGASIFDADFVISDDDTRMHLGDMTGPHHLYVARSYENDAAESRFYAKLHRAIAKAVGNRKTSEVFTEDQLASLFGGKSVDEVAP